MPRRCRGLAELRNVLPAEHSTAGGLIVDGRSAEGGMGPALCTTPRLRESWIVAESDQPIAHRPCRPQGESSIEYMLSRIENSILTASTLCS